MRWSEKEFEQFKIDNQVNDKKKTTKKKSKYNNKKTEVDGIKFDSRMEARYYQQLKLLEKAGQVTKIDLQPRFELQPTFKKNGKTHRSITYVADFLVTYKNGKKEVVDVKGMETQVFKIKHKMFEYMYEELHLKIVKRV